MTLENKTILITGGTGTFGQECTKQVLNLNPKAIRIYSRGEYLQWEMANKFQDNKLRFLIGDVRDKERLLRACQGVDIIIHAAALKQVPAIEYNPVEAVKTNILGSLNVIDCAIDSNVEKVIAISTDKAVHSVNTYGKTKAIMESLMIQGNVYGDTRFACVRYGNVEGSRGSVKQVFESQSKNGQITITDLRMTRFWISIESAVQFVIRCLSLMSGGEIFVPKIKSGHVVDYAKKVAPDCEIKVCGIRLGEKLHETLLSEEESRHAMEYEDYYIIYPEFPFWGQKIINGGRVLSDGFKYASG